MCTVSFYRNNKEVIITSNRDEHVDRPAAIEPKKTFLNGKALYFPKDAKAGGSWFVVDGQGSVFVLLNGAETKHIPNQFYRKSRGIILLEIAGSFDVNQFWENIDLYDIEPFTIICFVNNILMQLRWNGESKSKQKLDDSDDYIWSSSTLYEPHIINEREVWFSDYLNQKKGNVTGEDIINFHIHTQKENIVNGLVINRNGTMLTKNVTQCVLEQCKFTISHFDLISNTNTQIVEFIK